MMKEDIPQIVETHCTVVKCNGGDSVLGHPVVYLNLGLKGRIVCPYCSQEFVNLNLSS